MKWGELGRVNLFHIGGLVHHELGTIVLLSAFIWTLNVILLVVLMVLGSGERVYFVDGVKQPMQMVPYFGDKP